MNKSADILFLNCQSCFTAYNGTRVNTVMQIYPLLNVMSLAAMARERGFNVSVLDMGIQERPTM